MESRPQANFDSDAFAEKVRMYLEQDAELLGPAVQETVLKSEAPRHIVTMIRFPRKGEPVPQTEEWAYDSILFRREVLDHHTILERISKVRDGHFNSGRDEFPFPEHPSHACGPEPSRSAYCPWAGMLFETRTETVQVPEAPLVQPPLPPFANTTAALREFFQFQFHGHDGRTGHIWLFVPNYRARIADIALDRTTLRVTVETSEEFDQLFLQVSTPSPQLNRKITEKTTSVELPSAPEELNIWLSHSRHKLMDFYEENPHRVTEGWPGVFAKRQRPDFIHETLRPQGLNPPVFVVHGHDDGSKQAVARFLEHLGLTVVILHEQPDEGRTIIEKFETHAQQAGFTVVLLTPDDTVTGADSQALTKRARQNVIFELGYFIGLLGRPRVCALCKPGVEWPSDYSGILYTELDAHEAWKLRLAKELKNAGYSIDLNAV